METYIDQRHAVTANTLCCFFGHDAVLRIPAKIALVDIKAVGHGACYGNKTVQTVTIPPEIETVGENAFAECDSLKRVVFEGMPQSIGEDAFLSCYMLRQIELLNLPVSAAEYHRLKSHSTLLNDGTTVTAQVPEKLLPPGLLAALGTKYPAANVPQGIAALFCCEKPEDKQAFSLQQQYRQVRDGVQGDEEQQAIMRHIRLNKAEYRSPTTEQANDAVIKSEKSYSPEDVVVFTFDDRHTRSAENGYCLHVTLRVGHLFWQSAQKVVFDGRAYYIYRRHHLTHRPEMEYIRQDIAVYTADGPLLDQERARRIYAKYRLLSTI